MDKIVSSKEEKRCLSYSQRTDYGLEYDCEYEPVFSCDDCTFIVAHETGDKRRGKKPWAKCNYG